MPGTIIFDIDGTLLDSVDYHAQAWQETLARYGIEVPFEQVRGQIGKGGDQLLPVFVPAALLTQRGEEILAERGRHFKEKYLPLVRPFPQVKALFERLRADKRRVVLASSGTRQEVDEYRRTLGIGDLVEGDTTADDADKSKPHPDIFLAALEKLGDPDKATVVAVGDTPYDAEAAGKAGLRTVGVLCGGFPADGLRKAGCVAIFDDPEDLLKCYETWASGP